MINHLTRWWLFGGHYKYLWHPSLCHRHRLERQANVCD